MYSLNKHLLSIYFAQGNVLDLGEYKSEWNEVPSRAIFIETDGMVTSRGCGERGMELVFNGHRVSVWQDEEFCGGMMVMTEQQGECI